MPKYTRAYSILVERLREVCILQNLSLEYSQKKPLGSHDQEVNALCRGAIILLCAHIEGYSEDLSSLIIEKIHEKQVEKSKLGNGFRFYLSQDIIEEMRITQSPVGLESKMSSLFHRDLDIWSGNESFRKRLDPERFMKGFSSPNPEKIYRLFRRFGFNRIKHDMSIILNREYIFCENMVDSIVSTRHKIAHGDHIIAKTPNEVREMAEKARLFCRTLDKSVGDACKNIGFSIR